MATYQILSKSDHSRGIMTSYRFSTGVHGIAILFPVSDLVIPLTSEGRNLFADQILTGHLNPRLRYYYFRFQKTNGLHKEFYARFRFCSCRRYEHMIVHRLHVK